MYLYVHTWLRVRGMIGGVVGGSGLDASKASAAGCCLLLKCCRLLSSTEMLLSSTEVLQAAVFY